MSEFDKRFWNHDFESMKKLFESGGAKKWNHAKYQKEAFRIAEFLNSLIEKYNIKPKDDRK